MTRSGRRWSRIAGVAALCALAVAAGSAGAYTIPHGSRDIGLLNLSEDDGALAVYLGATDWGTTYYGGLPPQEQGGLGDHVVCLAYYLANDTGDVRAEGCFDGMNFTFERLSSLRVEDSFELELRDGDGTPLGSETVIVAVTITGVGVPYPGARAQTNPSPGAEVEYSFLRDATVAGTLVSPTLGTVDLALASAVLGHDDCVAFMAGEDNIESCRF